MVKVGDFQVLYNDIGLPVDADANAFKAGIAANAADGLVATNLETCLGASLIVRPCIKSAVTQSAREIGSRAATNGLTWSRSRQQSSTTAGHWRYKCTASSIVCEQVSSTVLMTCQSNLPRCRTVVRGEVPYAIDVDDARGGVGQHADDLSKRGWRYRRGASSTSGTSRIAKRGSRCRDGSSTSCVTESGDEKAGSEHGGMSQCAVRSI